MKVSTLIDGGIAGTTLHEEDTTGNTPIVFTIAADSQETWVLRWVTWSFDNIPNATLTITINGTQVYKRWIKDNGDDGIEFPQGLYATEKPKNQEMIITLSGGGAGVKGSMTARYY